jgi:hypothetical protein
MKEPTYEEAKKAAQEVLPAIILERCVLKFSDPSARKHRAQTPELMFQMALNELGLECHHPESHRVYHRPWHREPGTFECGLCRSYVIPLEP